MAASLLVCAVALLAMSEVQAEDCDELVAESMRTELLQSTAVLAKTHTHNVSPAGWREKATQSITPVFFLHVPKCGGSQFSASLLLFEGVCWNMTYQYREALLSGESHNDFFLLDAKIWEETCNLVDLRSYGYLFADHSGIGSVYSRYVKCQGLTFLRQPEQRILSGYNDHFHSWSYNFFDRPPSSELEYAKVVAGCAVKMLTRDGQSSAIGLHGTVCGDPAPATHYETTLAIERLIEGFPFVGILEEWMQSICLFHAMFGGMCTAQEFGSANTGTGSSSANSTSGYDTSVLKGWTDEQDGKLYAEGLRLFQNSLQHFHVNAENCLSCMQEAGIK